MSGSRKLEKKVEAEKVLSVGTTRAEMGEWNQRFLMKKGVIPLGFKVVMKGEDLNAEVVKVREE